ncbi:uncharacterized protein CDAR_176811 [Caerostris darwini]|uniref:Uncharacterized protein n=1 Tax=Caerostris darwini TaxID=1538125 RepID=A0AAV4PXY1_9ARAC|nr:uncharacterized protein CDAR_176811 [Caerostris darwini]
MVNKFAEKVTHFFRANGHSLSSGRSSDEQKLNWMLGGGVFSFHATNVLLHALAVVLLLYFCREVLAWRRDTSLMAALMFAAHPVHTEAVRTSLYLFVIPIMNFFIESAIASENPNRTLSYNVQ